MAAEWQRGEATSMNPVSLPRGQELLASLPMVDRQDEEKCEQERGGVQDMRTCNGLSGRCIRVTAQGVLDGYFMI